MFLNCIDGQKIAKRLAKNITKETRKATHLVQEYNNQCIEESSPISLVDVLSPDSTFWNAEARSESFKVRREIIEAFLRMERSTEALELLKSEMKSTMQYWLFRIQTLKQKVRQSTNDTIQPRSYFTFEEIIG